MVAVISLEKLTCSITDVPSAKAAQINMRCVMLLDAGMETIPLKVRGST